MRTPFTALDRRALVAFAATNRAVLLLLVLALATRLPLMSISLDEGDAANFVNALTRGYDITELRPHAPGYPVYILVGSAIDAVLNEPLLSLTLLSALMGSFAVVPFYLLLKELGGAALAFVGSLFFVFNPLAWSYGESALSDVPSASLVLLAAWLSYAGRRRDREFLLACVVMSLAIGVRQANAPLAVLLAFPLARIHRRTSLGTALEEASGCSSESGIMVLEQKPARKQGAPNRCCHRTNPTVSASSLTTIAWWPMPACSCRPP